jgi:hypothetical protein
VIASIVGVIQTSDFLWDLFFFLETYFHRRVYWDNYTRYKQLGSDCQNRNNVL